jgi:hypothetical protein
VTHPDDPLAALETAPAAAALRSRLTSFQWSLLQAEFVGYLHNHPHDDADEITLRLIRACARARETDLREPYVFLRHAIASCGTASPLPDGVYAAPDDPDLAALLALVEEPLITQVCGPADGDDGWRLPTAVADPQVPKAWNRVHDKILTAIEAARPRRMLAADGRHELLPLVPVRLDPGDVARLYALDATLQNALADDPQLRRGLAELQDLAELLDQVAGSWRELTVTDIVGALRRVLHILEVTFDPATRPVMLRLADVGAKDIVLNSAEENALRAAARRYAILIAPESPALQLYAYVEEQF